MGWDQAAVAGRTITFALASLLLGGPLFAAGPEPEASAGALLGAARKAEDWGRTQDALEGYRFVALAYPWIADHARARAVRVAVAAGEAEAAESAIGAFFASHGDSWLAAEVEEQRGDLALLRHAESDARRAWRAAEQRTSDDEVQRRLRWKRAESHRRSGELDEARALARALFRDAPTSPEGRLATRWLGTLESQGAAGLDARDRLAHAEALFAAGEHEAALDSANRAREIGLPASLDREAEVLGAHALFRMRRYPEAVDAFRALGSGDDAPFWLARALARSRQIDASIDQFQKVWKGGGTQAQRARFLRATLLEDDPERVGEARQQYAAIAASRAPARIRRQAAWKLGWEAYRRADAPEALRWFDTLAKTGDVLERLDGRYWAARARADREALAALAKAYPFSYYGWRAAQRTGAPTRAAGEPLGALGVSKRDQDRIGALVEAGLEEGARGELARVDSGARTTADVVFVAGAWLASGDAHRAQRLAVRGRHEELARGRTSGRVAVFQLAWPRPYWESVQKSLARATSGIGAGLVYSIMREESGYRPRVTSPVGARGLLQLMPETAARLARQAGEPEPPVDALFEPAVNVRLGVRYLDDLSRRFEGDAAAVAAGYNAGEEAVTRWRAARGELEDDEWVETIPYSETRAYVKRVLRSRAIYGELYR